MRNKKKASLSLLNNLRVLIPVIGVNVGGLVWMFYDHSLEEMTFPLILVLFAGIIPTLVLHVDYFVNDYNTELTINQREKIIHYKSKEQDIEYKFSDIEDVKIIVSFWHFLLIRLYTYYIISVKNGDDIKITCLSIRSLNIGGGKIKKLYTHIPLTGSL